ncbi:FliA/WhiG family RNA polymerase sigma factor [Aneurinibacillus aneurinilyticus]|jgi:RNA polymerase sigma factor for flagellar operon FliA|uniref:RNA polymerase sigma factor n=2 Tax=Aneurinibacillus aneurinilyticus TaxID=1391 RepID=A0A848CVA8_ANEAE|nr:FliA/WhiG family RNA polymerase sigma factor [Aneurinibacillus aneurinilyticus]ERI09236.1 RNA polymerase sigma factor, FliA/WhiG family [Aneurinibacillus aneurinilyticus ATCC 12856]MCI1692420.1 FliA/WhiG family RNA polymerase sigma factor [Aneurinibacillus aneurinilyticus]MED0669345.1 FliA/WhiG family RNA polymerase sigma factor [Aneurinibacillus aneurinilyticus]MED0707408.1 FliA/WhiG family RNA polymerase sigma factor [Aneurinibacillus aneurinilyticus]MED0724784.1 FliA/WhiG family RNA poly
MARKPKKQIDIEKWKRWREEGDRQSEIGLIEQYLPLVNYVANRLAIGLPDMVDKDDLISFGRLGLLDALKKFDYTRGLQFETYGMWRIRGAMIDGLRENDVLPRSIRDKAKKIEEAYTQLEQQNLRAATDEEVSKHLNISVAELNQTLQDVAFASVFSLDEPIQDDEDQKHSRQAVIMDEYAERPENALHKDQQKQILAEAIERLPPKERTIVSLFYYEECSLTEIAEIMGLSASRISQLHSKAIFRMRGSLQRAKDYLLNE